MRLFLTFAVGSHTHGNATTQHECDVAVAGGSLAGLIAALTAADVSPSIRVCLIEPTDWPGGQLTSSAVSALDFGHHNDDPKNMPLSLRSFVEMASARERHSQCYVSKWCFTPSWALNAFVLPALDARPNIHLMLRSVVAVTTTTDASDASDLAITSLQVVSRTPTASQNEWTVPLSKDLADWYSPSPSPRFSKVVSKVSASVFIEATELGDVLATASMPPISEKSSTKVTSVVGSGPRLAPPRLGVEVPTEDSQTTNAAWYRYTLQHT